MDETAQPAVDLQDPLPESSWLWRRVFVFSVTATVLWFLWGAINQLGAVAILQPHLGVPALLALCKWIISFASLMATYYMVAPSAEQIVKMIKVTALLRSGVQVARSRTVETTPDTTTTKTAKTVGLPPAPPVPEMEDGSPPWA